MGFFIFILIVVAAVAAYKMRVPLLAKILGQDEARIRRRIDRKRD